MYRIITQDVLTDITVSVKKLEKADIGFEGAYVHGVSTFTHFNTMKQNVILYAGYVQECHKNKGAIAE